MSIVAGTQSPTSAPPGMVWIRGGRFTMGSDDHYPEERRAHPVQVDGFFIDVHTVTNRQFAEFVAATGYVTVAERTPHPSLFPGADPADLVPGALVFQGTAGPVALTDHRQWWRFVPGADWRHPEGPDSDIDQRQDHPVVQVAYADALAYARWAGKSLPTEAQWEYAARGGLEGAPYAWGEELTPDGRVMANTWHGRFPWENLAPAGYRGTMPVTSFPPNGYGLYEVCGNVWEWTRDLYTEHHPAPAPSCCAPVDPRRNPRGASLESSLDRSTGLPRRVIKGGSWLCAPSYCLRYRPAARQPQSVDSATNHIGLRCVRLP
ncbi:formylglycine-generating enzyme family protein [Micromonospora sp. NPDC005299]|uniref:formylglycine-generating enzyme family protein n=1 Tax=Micromonospora sp. NPDC005299 TaxID=3364231 RepID=UPI0036C74BA2